MVSETLLLHMALMMSEMLLSLASKVGRSVSFIMTKASLAPPGRSRCSRRSAKLPDRATRATVSGVTTPVTSQPRASGSVGQLRLVRSDLSSSASPAGVRDTQAGGSGCYG